MSDFGGDSDFDDDEWLYVEDHYDEVDDLVEHTCPSPVAYETTEIYEYDPYDYWEDLAYLSDGVYDIERPKKKRKIEVVENGSKKRKAPPAKAERSSKQRRGTATPITTTRTSRKTPSQPIEDSIVVWKPQADREETVTGTSPMGNVQAETVAILKDWKDHARDAQLLVPIAEDEDEEIDDEGSPVNGEGFDLGNMQSVAELLSPDSIAAIKEMLKAQGLDPEAVEVVLRDIIAGKEPVFDDEEEDIVDEEGDHDDEDEDEEQLEDAQLPRVHVPEDSVADHVKEHDIAHTTSTTNKPLGKRGAHAFKTTNGTDTGLSSSTQALERDASLQSKRRKTKR